jgi:hypothetical protein
MIQLPDSTALKAFVGKWVRVIPLALLGRITQVKVQAEVIQCRVRFVWNCAECYEDFDADELELVQSCMRIKPGDRTMVVLGSRWMINYELRLSRRRE